MAVHADLPHLIRLQADARSLRVASGTPVKRRQAGQAASRQRGRGMSFAEVRLYQPGDDIRSIDWRVTARRQKPHTKLYEEERDRPVLLVCDLSPSLFFASTGAYKQVRCAESAALLAWLGLWGGDQVGGIIASQGGIEVVRPARRKKSVLRLLDLLAERQYRHADELPDESSGISRLDELLSETRRVAHTDSRIFILSDFAGMTERTSTLLRSIGGHNTLTALRLLDPLELRLPESGRFAVATPRGPVWLDAGDRTFREAFEDQVTQQEQQLEEAFRRAGVTPAVVSTAEAPSQVLRRVLGPRGRL